MLSQASVKWEFQHNIDDPDVVVRKAKTATIEVRDLNFTHLHVAPLFSCCRDVRATARLLLAGSDVYKKIPPVIVVVYRGRLWCRSNRRLKCYQMSGRDALTAKVVAYEELQESDAKWFRCRNPETFFDSDQKQAEFYPYSDCEECSCRCSCPSELRAHKMKHSEEISSGKIIGYNRQNGRGAIRDDASCQNATFTWRSLPKRFRFAHPRDLEDAQVKFHFHKEKGQYTSVWHIEVLQLPGRSERVALGGKLLHDDVRVHGRIAEYHMGSFGFLSVEIDFSGLSHGSSDYQASKLCTRLFHSSELPYQLCSCRRSSDLCGTKVEFKVVVDSESRQKAVRLCLLEGVVPKRRKSDNHIRCSRAQERRDHRFIFEADLADPFLAEQEELLAAGFQSS